MVASRTRMAMVLVALLLASSAALALTTMAWAQEEEPRITVDLKDARLEDALRLIFRPPYSFTLEPGVTGRVTVSLNDVTFSQALRAILDMNRLTYRKEANNLYVITRREETSAQPTVPETAVETPAAEQPVFWLGPGGRYELQTLDPRVVASWFGFGSYVLPLSPIPYAVDSPGGGAGGGIGGIGGGMGGIGGGIGGIGGGIGGIGGGIGGIGGGIGGTGGIGGIGGGTGGIGGIGGGTGGIGGIGGGTGGRGGTGGGGGFGGR